MKEQNKWLIQRSNKKEDYRNLFFPTGKLTLICDSQAIFVKCYYK